MIGHRAHLQHRFLLFHPSSILTAGSMTIGSSRIPASRRRRTASHGAPITRPSPVIIYCTSHRCKHQRLLRRGSPSHGPARRFVEPHRSCRVVNRDRLWPVCSSSSSFSFSPPDTYSGFNLRQISIQNQHTDDHAATSYPKPRCWVIQH